MSDSSRQFAVVPVKRPRQQVEDQLRQAILSGVFPIGRKLPAEAALATEFGVSRTTVREALRSLASEGLIEKVPGAGGGSFVRSVDHYTLGFELSEDIENLLRLGSIESDEVMAVRRMLEVPAVRLAAAHRTEPDLAELAAVVEAEKTTSHDDPTVAELDVRFHAAIGQASGNRILAAFVFALHQVSEPVLHLRLTPEVGRGAVRQHIAIHRAIADQDADAAETAILAHLEYLADHTT